MNHPDPLVVAYCTPGLYTEEAKRLKASLEKFDISYVVNKMDDQGDWYANTAVKPDFLKHMMESHKKPLLYLDVDAVVHEDVRSLFRGLPEQTDIAHVDFRGQVLSGTLWLNYTEPVMDLINRWIRRIKHSPKRKLEQISLRDELAEMMEAKQIWRYLLGWRYCYIHDIMGRIPSDPAIEHFQASRESHWYKDEPLAKLLVSRNRRVAEYEAAQG